MKKYLAWLPTIIIMITIFHFSHQPAVQSSQLSNSFAYRGIKMLNDWNILNLSDEECHEYAELIETPIRKVAHMTEYAILAFSVVFALSFWGLSIKKRFFIGLIICVVYASSDEFHQLFIPGRAGRVTDVLIDTLGSLIALGLCSIKRKTRQSLK